MTFAPYLMSVFFLDVLIMFLINQYRLPNFMFGFFINFLK